MADRGTPDAIRVPLSWRGASPDRFRRANHLMDLVEPLLGVGFGEAHARIQGIQGEVFVTRSLHDTLNFSNTHPYLAKTPRYDWEERPEVGKGVWFGYLKPEARDDAAV